MKKIILYCLLITFFCNSSELLRFLGHNSLLRQKKYNFLKNPFQESNIDSQYNSRIENQYGECLRVDLQKNKITIYKKFDADLCSNVFYCSNPIQIKDYCFNQSGNQVLIVYKKCNKQSYLLCLFDVIRPIDLDNNSYSLALVSMEAVRCNHFISCNFLNDNIIIMSININSRGYLICLNLFFEHLYRQKTEQYTTKRTLNVDREINVFTDGKKQYNYAHLINWYNDNRYTHKALNQVEYCDLPGDYIYRNKNGYLVTN